MLILPFSLLDKGVHEVLEFSSMTNTLLLQGGKWGVGIVGVEGFHLHKVGY